ncbi:maleate cis-trans isomerase family protein [Marivivens aquimaris]|uniref:maleate cis-trans isomerase family protein n=1 Tax=Marivivens aquimaris TaxID=2774876 RepID=UPI00187EB1EB|nr:aspartate/glutamate racemase family protein [Marivivens aquimaris]
MGEFPYELVDTGAQKTFGLIVLSVDETIEHDFRHLLPDEVYLHVSRVQSGDELGTETIAAMEDRLPAAAALLPPAANFDVVAYACTSASAQIGPERVAELVGGACTTATVTNPLTAAIAAMQALGVKRLAIVSPYVPEVAEPVRAAFEAAGINVLRTLSFGEAVEANVVRIDQASISAAAHDVVRDLEVEAVFLSCTNLRTLDAIDGVEAELGLPVISSNLALAWQMARLAGFDLAPTAPGKLAKR